MGRYHLHGLDWALFRQDRGGVAISQMVELVADATVIPAREPARGGRRRGDGDATVSEDTAYLPAATTSYHPSVRELDNVAD